MRCGCNGRFGIQIEGGFKKQIEEKKEQEKKEENKKRSR
jgi:hypothetical protein